MHNLPCPDLAGAIAFFTEKLDFRLDMIMPADSPRVAVVSREGLELRLEHAGAESPREYTSNPTRPVVCREKDSEWIVGRAGMEYRDLIPDRLGGRVIASHIRLTRGGEVPDYVHYHKIGFQMVFCKAGRIRVVYQDQGEPFWLEPGDCVLQPPGMRHRVLEAEAGSEVIEISSPAEHETWVDHEMTLPTDEFRPNVEYSGQRFVRHIAKDAEFIAVPDTDSRRQFTNIADASYGALDVSVDRVYGRNGGPSQHLGIADGLCFLFVLDGRVKIVESELKTHELSSNDSVLLTSDVKLLPTPGEICQMLHVRLPNLAGQASVSG
jgi:quercetin dioxygenase-like cupin family protein